MSKRALNDPHRASGLTRRALLAGAAAGAVAPMILPRPFAWAQGRSDLHGLSVFGDLKYPADFKHFDYRNPDAAKGGVLRFQVPNWIFNQNPQTFNTLNSFVLKGDAPPRMELCFDTLMTSASDEPDSIYGLLAKSVAVSEDGNVFTFTLRDGARFHDGSPLTAEDVAFSMMLLKEQGHPNLAEPIREMAKAEAVDAKTVKITLTGRQNRETILTVAGLPIFSRAYYTSRTFNAATMDPPLSSGAYKVGLVNAGRTIEYHRVADYWAKDLSVNAGAANFDVIRIDFYRERQTAFEAFKKGDITLREEFTSITWANDYNFPAIIDGRVKKTLFPTEAQPSLQGFFMNTRRPAFSDPRTREGLALAFDFEATNKNLFFDSYVRSASYFEKSDFRASGKPGPEELALLEPFRNELPASVFEDAYVPPKTDGSGGDRKILRRASELLGAAGWKQQSGRLVTADGEVLTLEFLIDEGSLERVLTPYIANLRRIGVTASIRQVDSAQYQRRLNNFDFDMLMAAYRFSATPLDGLNQFFGGRAADIPGSYNLAGIKLKSVDALLERLPRIASRDELIVVTKTIDRILRAHHYWVPNWYLPDHRVAHWDLFGWPAEKPPYAFSPETTWWLDTAKASAAGRPGG